MKSFSSTYAGFDNDGGSEYPMGLQAPGAFFEDAAKPVRQEMIKSCKSPSGWKTKLRAFVVGFTLVAGPATLIVSDENRLLALGDAITNAENYVRTIGAHTFRSDNDSNREFVTKGFGDDAVTYERPITTWNGRVAPYTRVK